MTFASPWMLLSLAVLPAAIAGYAVLVRQRADRRAALAAQGLVLTPASQRIGMRRHLPPVLMLVGVAVLLTAFARPHASFGIPHREGTVILAFDISNSMKADDLKPTRIEAAKQAARLFVARQPTTIRIGVVAFSDGALVTQAPTDVRADVLAAIDRLAPMGGTSLGKGIFASLTAIAGKPIVLDEAALQDDAANVDIGHFPNAVIVLLTDGENTSGPDPLVVARLASVAGVAIDTIGIGSSGGTVVTIDGFSVATALDEPALTDIATTTNGKYFAAPNEQALAEVYKSVDLKLVTRSEHREITAVFTAAGLLVLVLAGALSLWWFGKVI
jgi:Ca-activated chloride channel homolog